MDILWMLYKRGEGVHWSQPLCYYYYCAILLSYSILFVGNIDTYSWHRSDPWVVSADPWEATGAEHHGPGQQQHSCDAGRVIPCLQNRVLNSTWLPGSHLYSQMVRYSLNCSLLSVKFLTFFFLTFQGLKQHILSIAPKPHSNSINFDYYFLVMKVTRVQENRRKTCLSLCTFQGGFSLYVVQYIHAYCNTFLAVNS